MDVFPTTDARNLPIKAHVQLSHGGHIVMKLQLNTDDELIEFIKILLMWQSLIRLTICTRAAPVLYLTPSSVFTLLLLTKVAAVKVAFSHCDFSHTGLPNPCFQCRYKTKLTGSRPSICLFPTELFF